MFTLYKWLRTLFFHSFLKFNRTNSVFYESSSECNGKWHGGNSSEHLYIHGACGGAQVIAAFIEAVRIFLSKDRGSTTWKGDGFIAPLKITSFKKRDNVQGHTNGNEAAVGNMVSAMRFYYCKLFRLRKQLVLQKKRQLKGACISGGVCKCCAAISK